MVPSRRQTLALRSGNPAVALAGCNTLSKHDVVQGFYLRNREDESVTIDVAVEDRAAGEMVLRSSYALAPGETHALDCEYPGARPLSFRARRASAGSWATDETGQVPAWADSRCIVLDAEATSGTVEYAHSVAAGPTPSGRVVCNEDD